MSDTPRAAKVERRDTVASAVLLYDLNGSTVTASLLSPVDGAEFDTARSIELEDFSPEQIGLTVPMLWDLVDVAHAVVVCIVTSGAAADIDVAPPILELAFGVPVYDSATPESSPETASSDNGAATATATAAAVTSSGAAPRPSLRPVRQAPAAPVRRSGTGAGKSGVVKSGTPAPTVIKKSGIARAGVAGAVAASAVAASRSDASAKESVPADLAGTPVDSKQVDSAPVEGTVVSGGASAAGAVSAAPVDPALAASDPDTEVFEAVTVESAPRAFGNVDSPSTAAT
ncbi:MAG: hypothetical protein WBF79_09515, partial [Rhodococcus sp. (in: high G+C Gram-positive bacteria)]